MLRLLSILLIAVFTYGCSGNETDKHTHDDGTTHEAHDESKPHEHTDSLNTQEEFTVGDTTKTEDHGHEHPHGDDHNHDGDHKH
jgi:hypothetical protein